MPQDSDMPPEQDEFGKTADGICAMLETIPLVFGCTSMGMGEGVWLLKEP